MSQSEEVGYVISSRDFIVFLDGLPTVKINDMVISDSGVRGLVSSLHPDKIEVLILDEGEVLPGQMFKKSPTKLALNSGDFLLGRAINPLGIPLDNKSLLKSQKGEIKELDRQADGIASREFITKQFLTGMTLVDTLIPLGKGQRELIMGDAHSGKTTFLVDLIINQKQTNTVCIYTLIGKPISQVKILMDILKSNDALKNTVIIATSSSDPAPLIYLAPQAGFTIAEYFQNKGQDVLLILDDMGIHAKIYREISLLGNKSPGRESYPGDIFYQHAHLLERGGNFNKTHGGASITALPVIELNLNDFTSFIPTNLMGMTDGHLLFKSSLHNQGQKPAIDIQLSVSRVGRQTQNRVQNLISSKVRQVLAKAEELETVSSFSAELPVETQILLRQKSHIMEIIRQESLTFIPIEIQTILLALVFSSFLSDKDASFVINHKNILIENFIKNPKIAPLTQNFANFKTDTELIDALEKIKPQLEVACLIPNTKTNKSQSLGATA